MCTGNSSSQRCSDLPSLLSSRVAAHARVVLPPFSQSTNDLQIMPLFQAFTSFFGGGSQKRMDKDTFSLPTTSGSTKYDLGLVRVSPSSPARGAQGPTVARQPRLRRDLARLRLLSLRTSGQPSALRSWLFASERPRWRNARRSLGAKLNRSSENWMASCISAPRAPMQCTITAPANASQNPQDSPGPSRRASGQFPAGPSGAAR